MHLNSEMESEHLRWEMYWENCDKPNTGSPKNNLSGCSKPPGC